MCQLWKPYESYKVSIVPQSLLNLNFLRSVTLPCFTDCILNVFVLYFLQLGNIWLIMEAI